MWNEAVVAQIVSPPLKRGGLLYQNLSGETDENRGKYRNIWCLSWDLKEISPEYRGRDSVVGTATRYGLDGSNLG